MPSETPDPAPAPNEGDRRDDQGEEDQNHTGLKDDSKHLKRFPT